MNRSDEMRDMVSDCRLAPSGEGSRAYDWADKPHRLVYDLCRAVEEGAAALDREAKLLEALKMISQESKEDDSVMGRSVFKALRTCGDIADLALAETQTEGLA